MSTTTAVRPNNATNDPRVGKVDLRLEVVTIPVSDVDRAQRFYESHDHVVQFTPPGSLCSIHFGTNLTTAAPGSAQGILLIVSDAQAARDELVRRGVDASEVFHFAGWNRVAPDARVSGPAPDGRSYGSFVSFTDPDGNGWLLQEITTRLPGRVDAAETAFASVADLRSALWRAAVAHGEHEKRTGGQHDVNWPDWYAAYMVAEQHGAELPQ
jgi:catechol 2,3-dioxygenase-like lactoylglutathione lyase family enzyme